MTPAYKILANSVDITNKLRERSCSIKVVDEAGLQSDTVEIELDDEGGQIEMPRKGATLDVSIGYLEAGLVRMGLYVVDEVGLSGFPALMTIRGKAADMRATIKTQRARSWDTTTLGAIVKSIAAEEGLEAKVDPALAAIEIAHEDQTTESNIHFLTRLAQQYGAVAKPANGKLLMVPAGQATTASGASMPSVTVHKTDETHYDVTLADRDAYDGAVASWHDPKTGQRIPEQTGSSSKAYTLRDTYPDAASARRAAEAKWASLQRGAGTLNLDMPGEPKLAAEATINLPAAEFRSGVAGEWITKRVEHTIKGSFTTHIEAEAPAGGAHPSTS